MATRTFASFAQAALNSKRGAAFLSTSAVVGALYLREPSHCEGLSSRGNAIVAFSQQGASPMSQGLMEALGPKGVGLIWAANVIGAAERYILRHPLVAAQVGHVYAGGSYKMAAAATSAEGWYSATLPGKIKARVFLQASRPSKADSWDFSQLRLEIDRKALEGRALQRRAAADKAGYHGAEAAAAAGSASSSSSPSTPAAGPAVDVTEEIQKRFTGNTSEQHEDVVVFQLIPDPAEAAAAEAAAAASPVSGAAEKAEQKLQ